MAMFNFSSSGAYGSDLWGSVDPKTESISVDDALEILRPAGMKLVEYYRQAIRERFQQRTGSLADSFDFEDYYLLGGWAGIIVKPYGRHKSGMYQRRSRAGDPSAKYAKHYRHPEKKRIANTELMYLLEYGTPRIPASHVIEETNERVYEEIQDIIESGFDDLLKKKGLI